MRLRAARGRAVAAALARPTRGLAALATKPYRLPEQLRGRPGRSDQAVQVDLSSVPQRGGAAVLEPGLVVLRGALDAAEQRRLGSEAWAAGCGQRNPAHTFFEADGSLRGPRGTRGRIFDACLRFGPRLTGLLLPACAAWVSRARALDASMPGHEASHLLMLYYPEGGTLGFHRDEQANDGTGDEPVVNLSLGVLTLRSGDVVLFGGPCRRLLHAVVATRRAPAGEEVLPDAAAGGRLSFTLRHAPEVLGKEHLYADFRPGERRGPTGDEQLLGQRRPPAGWP
ncbi:unnamed protein product [Prorocentrum cordatum]|uniref:Alpha-ketoglutarate-dependent dioxygenase AlkB-like domain-containing protein n=1 Tax=Prorocentrum cordatum TaxID=2364126 RepID=A0ABN9XYB8_9DINO|nr:unnamed protein product [Polarella glacialis]